MSSILIRVSGSDDLERRHGFEHDLAAELPNSHYSLIHRFKPWFDHIHILAVLLRITVKCVGRLNILKNVLGLSRLVDINW